MVGTLRSTAREAKGVEETRGREEEGERKGKEGVFFSPYARHYQKHLWDQKECNNVCIQVIFKLAVTEIFSEWGILPCEFSGVYGRFILFFFYPWVYLVGLPYGTPFVSREQRCG